jgi:hypothetical protein
MCEIVWNDLESADDYNKNFILNDIRNILKGSEANSARELAEKVIFPVYF